MKFLGKDIIDFYTNGFPDDHYIEDVDYDELGLTEEQELIDLDPDKKYDGNVLGVIINETDSWNIKEFQTLLKKWLKQKTTETIVLEIDKTMKEDILTQLKSMNGVKICK